MVVIRNCEMKSGSVGDGAVETGIAVSHIESNRLSKGCGGEGEFADEGSVDE